MMRRAICAVLLLLLMIAQGCAGSSPADSRRIIGSYGVNLVGDVRQARSLGLNVAVLGAGILPRHPDLRDALTAHHISVYDDGVLNLLRQYECFRQRSIRPNNPIEPCPIATDETATLRAVAAYLNEPMIASNPLIAGFYVLDDWPSWDPGSARPLLEAIHGLIDQANRRYKTTRNTICGFGEHIGRVGQPYSTTVAQNGANFTQKGCDLIAIYSYTDSLDMDSSHFDWDMSDLPFIELRLRQAGWDPATTPFLGVPQAFGGTPNYLVPSASDVARQSAGFCRGGAAGIIYFTLGTQVDQYRNVQTASNDLQIDRGIREGIAACQRIWK